MNRKLNGTGLSAPARQVLEIANEQFARGDLKTSAVLLQAVVALAAGDPLLLAALGSLHFRLGEFEPARRRFQEAIRLDPANPLLHAKLGAAWLGLHDLPATEAALERALVLDPDCEEALQLLANTHLQCGKADQAAALYHRLVALNPGHTEARLALGKALFLKGDTAGARGAFEQVLALEPASRTAQENLAALRAGGGAPQPAAAAAGGPGKPNGHPWPAEVAPWVAQAEEANARGQLPAALGALRQAARLAPLCAPLWIALANVQTRLCLHADALESCLAAEALQPEAADTQVRFAAAALRCEDIRRFDSAMERALQIEPTHPGALRLLADLNFEHHRCPDAARQYRQILEQAPGDGAAALGLARCELEAGNLEAALRAFEKALALDPASEPARQGLDRTLEKVARQTAARFRDGPKVNWIGVTSRLAQLDRPVAPVI